MSWNASLLQDRQACLSGVGRSRTHALEIAVKHHLPAEVASLQIRVVLRIATQAPSCCLLAGKASGTSGKCRRGEPASPGLGDL